MKALRHSLLVVAALLLLSGCAGYRLGPTNGLDAGDKSVQVNAFYNATLQPRLSDAVIQQLRKQLQHDATYHLATHDDGDILLSGTITRYDRFELSVSSNDVLTGQDYRLVMITQVKAIERGTGKVLLDKPVTASTLIRVGTDLTSAERQALPLLAEDLARKVTALLADGAW